ncbi:MAG: type III-A CRISPR-associated protein Cas10/Csm1 [Abditibacteriales bacterium]|nr:type III-A CRISPR-associated protein Cas10/Csm1 [Abditibacteriales bacterium]MDW8365486.1 type III-A CRISPR-associated protein Cas10/Csm1 [Abditibacteriales bacterium]
MTEEQTLWLAALFHDAGKVSQRIGGEYRQRHAAMSDNFVRSLRDYLGEEAAQAVSALASAHHAIPSNRAQRLLHVADKLAALERTTEQRARLNSDEAALVSVTSRVQFRSERAPERYQRLVPLDLTEEALFPTDDERVEAGRYESIWDAFVNEMRQLPPFRPADFTTLLALLRRYGANVPSATPWESDEEHRTVPDVSLYDHTKVVTAIVACLAKLDADALPDERLNQLIELLRRFKEKDFVEQLKESEEDKPPLALFVRGDVGGIQKFIFRVARPEADTDGVAKRLRGRSFFVAFLTQVIAEWIARKCQLPPTNVLYCGGGTFDLLLPATDEAREVLKNVERTVGDFLLTEAGGELSLQLAQVELRAYDFVDFRTVYRQATERLAEIKQRRGMAFFSPEFFAPARTPPHLCLSCGVTEVPEPSVCHICELHRDIGRKLPDTDSVACLYQSFDELQLPDNAVSISLPWCGVTVVLLNEREREVLLRHGNIREAVLTRLNRPDKFILQRGDRDIGFRFQFLANEVPTRHGNTLDFDAIARLSTGAARLGVLKMDVDYLGLVFGLGLEPPSVSRLATLSSAFEMFFGGWLNILCQDVSCDWKQGRETADDKPLPVDGGVFYTLYAGGDDVFVIGPWDATLWLARAVNADFRRFVGDNPNLSLSAGVVCVKPKFPVPRFAELAERALKRAKEGRDDTDDALLRRGDRITLFDTAVPWQRANELLQLADELEKKVESNEVSKSFVYFLLRLHEAYFADPDCPSLLWVPRFHYQLARRVPQQVIGELKLLQLIPRLMRDIRVAVSTVSLKMRKE